MGGPWRGYGKSWVYCKKMQKKCKKMQKYLHMSKKSSTFVADLGIVPSATIKYSRVMEKLMICSLKYGDVIYKVNELVDEDGNGHGFRVMKGRCIAKGGAFFNSERAAIMFMLRYVFNDVAQLELEGLL